MIWFAGGSLLLMFGAVAIAIFLVNHAESEVRRKRTEPARRARLEKLAEPEPEPETFEELESITIAEDEGKATT